MRLQSEVIQNIRAQSLQADQRGKLDDAALETAIARGWFKLFVPKQLGGKMLSLPEALQVFEHAAWVDGSFGWLVSVGSGGGYFVPFMEPEVSKQLFTPENAVVAGSGMPAGTAVREGDGFRLNGQWKYCSGALHATIFTANAIIENDTAGSPEIRAFIMDPDQVEIIKDWHAFGLKATESHTIAVRDQWVPKERTFSLTEPLAYADEAVYRFPFVPFAETSFAVVALGICKHFLEHAQHMSQEREAGWDAGMKGRTAFVQTIVEQAEQKLLEQRSQFYQTVGDVWDKHVGGMHCSDTEWTKLSQICKQSAQTALRCGQDVFSYLGISAIMECERINLLWRDLQTACQHTMLVPFETADKTGE